ncbi:MAG: HAD family hydrolase, partial [Clostridia bacterium]|nr:HAD family hydrolase [Clostridia bacterium]
EEMIEKLHKQGYRQAVISGFETNRLKSSLDKFGLSRYFEFMSGADDIACGDKSERAVQALKAYGFDPHNTLFIGDMYHDYEAASKSGADCVLIAKGHQGKQVLESYGVVPVLESASQLDEYL